MHSVLIGILRHTHAHALILLSCTSSSTSSTSAAVAVLKDANPWCQPTWIKDTSQSNISIADMESPPLRTDEEGSFTMLIAKESDSGWYRCVCDHELGVDGHSASYGYFLNVRCESSLPP